MNPEDLLEQIKNLSLSYNSKVTPRRRIDIQKPENALTMLLQNERQRNEDAQIQQSKNSIPTHSNLQMSMEERKGEDKKLNDSSQRPKRYKVYTADEKRELIKLSESPMQNPNTIAKLKGIGVSNIKRWKCEFEKDTLNFGYDHRRQNARKVKYPELDEHLKAWFKRLREAKVAVSGIMMTNEARDYITKKDLQGITLSNGWLCKLLKRLQIVKRKATKVSQKSASSFQNDISKFVASITEHR